MPLKNAAHSKIAGTLRLALDRSVKFIAKKEITNLQVFECCAFL